MSATTDIKDRLSHAHSKMQFIGWALAASASSGQLMGDLQLDGLAFILQDVQDTIGLALECDLMTSEDLSLLEGKSKTSGDAG